MCSHIIYYLQGTIAKGQEVKRMYTVIIYTATDEPKVIIAHSKTEVLRTIESNAGKDISVYDYEDNNTTAEFID